MRLCGHTRKIRNAYTCAQFQYDGSNCSLNLSHRASAPSMASSRAFQMMISDLRNRAPRPKTVVVYFDPKSNTSNKLRVRPGGPAEAPRDR